MDVVAMLVVVVYAIVAGFLVVWWLDNLEG